MASAKYPVKSLIKAIRLLEELSLSPDGSTIAFLSKKLRMGKSTVHRLLMTLRDMGLVWVDPITSNYALGAKILQLSESVAKQNLLLRLGLPVIRKLAEQSNETVNLGALEGNEVLYLAKQESTEPLRMSGEVGKRLPAHCTALGKVLLAGLHPSEAQQLYRGVRHLPAATANSLTTPERLWEHLQTVRREGVAYDFEEIYEGVICLAAPVKDYTGRTVAAISISMPKQRLSGERMMRFKEYLRSACAELSDQLGHAHVPEPNPHQPVANPVPSDEQKQSELGPTPDAIVPGS